MKQYKVWYNHNNNITYSFHKNLEIATRRKKDIVNLWSNAIVKVFEYNNTTNKYDREVLV